MDEVGPVVWSEGEEQSAKHRREMPCPRRATEQVGGVRVKGNATRRITLTASTELPVKYCTGTLSHSRPKRFSENARPLGVGKKFGVSQMETPGVTSA